VSLLTWNGGEPVARQRTRRVRRRGPEKRPSRKHGTVLRPDPTTTTAAAAAAAAACAGAASHRGSRGAWSTPRPGWAATAGRSSAPARGWAGSGGYGSATSAPPSGSTRCRCWPARAPASTPAWLHLKTSNPIGVHFSSVRLRTRVTKVPAPRPWAGHGVQAAGGCQDRWPGQPRPHLVALVRCGQIRQGWSGGPAS
jgi:hypothetical protein